jgi:hypothetical protein
MPSSSSIHAEVSSITDTIAGLRERIASLAPALGSPETEDLLSSLFEAERALLAAGRHLERAKRLSRRDHGP